MNVCGTCKLFEPCTADGWCEEMVKRGEPGLRGEREKACDAWEKNPRTAAETEKPC